jgi:hypothetical protein
MKRSEVRKKIKAFKNAGLLEGFNEEQLKNIENLYINQQKFLLQERKFNYTFDEKFLFKLHQFKTYICQ